MPKEADRLNPQDLRQILNRINTALAQPGHIETPGQSGESPESPDQNPQPELTPAMTKQALEGINFGPAQQRIVDALLESFDQGLEDNSLAKIASASSSYSALSTKRSNLKGLISKINARTRPHGLEINREEIGEGLSIYRWQKYTPPPPDRASQLPAAEDELWNDESSQDSPPPVQKVRETVINLSPESQVFANQIGRDIAQIVTSEILREKNDSNGTLITNLPADILELSSAESRSKFDNALAGLTEEEKRRVLLQSTIKAIERAWAMSEARWLESKEDLAIILNCHGLARRGHFLGEITIRLSEHFQMEIPPVEDPIKTS